MYIAIEDSELPEAEPYLVLLRAAMAATDYAEAARREQAEHCLAELWNLLTDSPGIEVHEMSGVVSEEEISIHELRALKRWDFDWLSSPGPLE